MLKFFMMLMFMFLLKKSMWLIKEFFFIIFFLFFIFMIPSFNFLTSYYFLLDNLSFGLILLSFWIISMLILSSESLFYKNDKVSEFLLMILFLMLFLFLSFSVMNLLLFYLFFEMSLIPTLFLILGWGYQPERVQAGMYMLFYTLFMSLPLLLGIFYIKFNYFSLSFIFFNNFIVMNNWLLYFVLILAFLVKMPMFFIHLWLPKAHVEAPVSGSMILAGVLLKLGGYGLFRVLPFLISINNLIYYYWIIISILGGVMISLSCLVQVDFKSLIAYSSVVHMGLILSSVFNYSSWGLNSGLLLMISHGLCSSGMFFLANICYERMMNRSMLINKGLMNLMPSFSLWWFLLLSSNMAAPPSLNLLSEIMLLISILNWSKMTFLLLGLFSFFSVAYCLYLFSFSQYGNMFSLLFSYSSCKIREILVLFLHWVPLNVLILKSDIFVLWL